VTSFLYATSLASFAALMGVGLAIALTLAKVR
jgi:hypothetical protein